MMKSLLTSDLIQSDRLRRFVPGPVKRVLKRGIPYADYRSEQLLREAERRFGGPVPMESDYDSPYPVTLGIFFDSSYTFAFNVAACRDLKVQYKVIDLLRYDWMHRVVESECDAFLATPPTLRKVWREVFEERLWIVTYVLQKRVCPTFDELYLWESKRRMRDWLLAHNVPHPETWVFLTREEAQSFCLEARYPIVCKTDSGAASSGIFVLRDRPSAERMVNQAFSRGILARSADPREREQGIILFQEFIPHNYEWRIVRIGDDFMCRRKVRAGDFASGSGDIGWAAPLPGMLDFAKRVTGTGGFTSMSVDMFENASGRTAEPYLVNELQAIIGFREVEITGHTGRWRSRDPGHWAFEPGCFHNNACANLRVQMLLSEICSPTFSGEARRQGSS